jgi:hypothetical protein
MIDYDNDSNIMMTIVQTSNARSLRRSLLREKVVVRQSSAMMRLTPYVASVLVVGLLLLASATNRSLAVGKYPNHISPSCNAAVKCVHVIVLWQCENNRPIPSSSHYQLYSSIAHVSAYSDALHWRLGNTVTHLRLTHHRPIGGYAL